MRREDQESLVLRGRETGVRLIGREPFSVSEILAIANGLTKPVLDDDPDYRAALRASRETFERVLSEGQAVYGVTTGVGAAVTKAIPPERREEMAHNIFRFHGCGTGVILEEVEAAAIVAVRLVTLARGYSGVREVVLERLCDLLEHRLLPRIPAEGSVGASGDLTPLSYVAAALVGEREVTLRGRVLPARDALEEVGLSRLSLEAKESLSLMNGTSAMTGLGCIALQRAFRLARFASTITAMGVDVTHGNRGHYDERIFELKPHPGQAASAGWIREALEYTAETPGPKPARLQDRYSFRCSPHVIGVLVDAAREADRILEIEINGVDDNPIVDAEAGQILHGGNFYGGHVCFAMDSMKTAIANVADLLDRQLVLLCSPETSDGLPVDLVAPVNGGDGSAVAHHGFKAMQITASALTAEALKLTMPASAFSRSTESHNQDKVSMGMIAARDCLRILELTETVATIVLLAACQAVDLRGEEADLKRSGEMRDAVRKAVPMVDEDRRQDLDIARILELYRSDSLPIGASDEAR